MKSKFLAIIYYDKKTKTYKRKEIESQKTNKQKITQRTTNKYPQSQNLDTFESLFSFIPQLENEEMLNIFEHYYPVNKVLDEFGIEKIPMSEENDFIMWS
jgi:hypothetical protein